MKRYVALVLTLMLVGQSYANELAGVWRATSVDMSFAAGRIAPENIEDARQFFLKEKAPGFDLNANGTAQIFRPGGDSCSGSWSIESNIVTIKCSNSFMRLEKKDDKLTSLPDRSFTFEKR